MVSTWTRSMEFSEFPSNRKSRILPRGVFLEICDGLYTKFIDTHSLTVPYTIHCTHDGIADTYGVQYYTYIRSAMCRLDLEVDADLCDRIDRHGERDLRDVKRTRGSYYEEVHWERVSRYSSESQSRIQEYKLTSRDYDTWSMPTTLIYTAVRPFDP